MPDSMRQWIAELNTVDELMDLLEWSYSDDLDIDYVFEVRNLIRARIKDLTGISLISRDCHLRRHHANLDLTAWHR